MIMSKVSQYEFKVGAYELELHEKVESISNSGQSPIDILRVPGGWIYYMYNSKSGTREGTFVPWNNEFQSRDWKLPDNIGRYEEESAA